MRLDHKAKCLANRPSKVQQGRSSTRSDRRHIYTRIIKLSNYNFHLNDASFIFFLYKKSQQLSYFSFPLQCGLTIQNAIRIQRGTDSLLNCKKLNSRSRCHMWVEFVVGSRLCSERFFSGYSGFLLSSKTNISKFQFDPEPEGHRLVSPRLLCATLVKQS